MIFSGEEYRLQTYGALASQLFDSTLRTFLLVVQYCREEVSKVQ